MKGCLLNGNHKIFLLLFILMVPMMACLGDRKPTSAQKIPAEEPGTSVIPVPFEGYWLSEDYYQAIQKDRSPRKAQEGSEECLIQLPGFTWRPTSMVYNFHEVGPDLVIIKNNEGFQLWEKQGDSIVRMAFPIDIISGDRIRIGEKSFIKIHPLANAQETRILEEILFQGEYADEENHPIIFKNNGEVSGLGNYKYYSPVIDYFDAGLQVDQVGLGASKEQLDYFGFKFKQDKLILYTLHCKKYDESNNRCLNVSFGPKVYELTRL